MGGIFSSLSSSLDALRTLQNALEVSQNNVSNSSTPGYARQVATFEAQPFNPAGGLAGGVEAGPTQSTQNEYANQAVRTEYSAQGYYSAQSSALSSIQSLFDVSGQTGVLGALNNLFQSFSAWSATPDSTAAQQSVIANAQALAQSFQSTSASLAQTTSSLNQQISSTVQQVNTLASAIQQDNVQIQKSGGTPDAGVSANLEASLESLSQLVDTTVTFAPDGTATVLLGQGQSPLVIGTQQYSLSASFTGTTPGGNANAVPDAQILDSNGDDVTSQFSQGSLGGLLNVRNTVLPSLQGDASQQGELNQLAQQVADSVNQVLTSSTTLSGQTGGPLLDYSSSSPVEAAQTLTVDPNITPGTLAPTDPGPPPVQNGAALTLSNLGNSTDPADQIDGQTILQFLNGIATQVGQQASDAQTGQTLHSTLLTQAQAVQTQISGVSLDAEAVQVLQLQQGYSAVGKMVSVVDSLAGTLISMVGTG
ncbi:MAG: flagellar hook-associated protein FlgK [Bryobacteraceae bacterium]|jgi:flagellar hook-associated protein 1 FlgK